MCRETVANFPDIWSLARFYREVKKDGSRNRCWYRVTVTARISADGQIKGHVSDVIAPAPPGQSPREVPGKAIAGDAAAGV
jgi:hypothetical protein